MAAKKSPADRANGGEADCSALGRAEQTENYTADLSSATAVYDGRRVLGWMKPKGDQFEAITPERRSLGRFNSAAAAWRALAAEGRV